MEKYSNCIDNIVSIVNEIGSGCETKKEKDFSKKDLLVLDLLQRIVANLEICSSILKEIATNYNSKIPLAILIRSCLSDAICGFYLLSFNKKSFEEELDVIDLDFVKYLKDMLILEVELMNDYFRNNKNIQDEFDVRFEQYSKYLSSEKGENWVVKKASDFRVSNPTNEKISIKSMGSRIKFDNKTPKEFGFMYNLYRYFSQYEHYSFVGRDLVKQPFENDFLNIQTALFLIFNSIKVFVGSLDNVSEELQDKIKNIEYIY